PCDMGRDCDRRACNWRCSPVVPAQDLKPEARDSDCVEIGCGFCAARLVGEPEAPGYSGGFLIERGGIPPPRWGRGMRVRVRAQPPVRALVEAEGAVGRTRSTTYPRSRKSVTRPRSPNMWAAPAATNMRPSRSQSMRRSRQAWLRR